MVNGCPSPPMPFVRPSVRTSPGLWTRWPLADASISFGRPDGTDAGHDRGEAARRARPHFPALRLVLAPLPRPTRAHEELASYIDGSEWQRATTTPASTCSDAALTRTVAFRSAFPNLHARARADLMTLRNLAGVVDQLRTFGRDGRTT